MPAQSSSCKKRISIFCAVKAGKRTTGIAAALLLLALLVFGKNLSFAAAGFQKAPPSSGAFALPTPYPKEAYAALQKEMWGWSAYPPRGSGEMKEQDKKAKTNAQLGDRDAMYDLGDMYFEGRSGDNVDIGKALAWYKRAAEKGKWEAQIKLAFLYAIGYGASIKPDDAEALKWYMASGVGELDAVRGIASKLECSIVGQLWYRNHEIDPWDSEKNQKNDTGSSHTCGSLLNSLRLMPPNSHYPFAVTARWYEYLGERGDLDAQKRLAAGYDKEYGGNIEYLKKAVYWNRKAAEQGDTISQLTLAAHLLIGHSTLRDEAEAAKWLIKAAEHGDAAAQWIVGQMYAEGRGVARDDEQAVKWFRLAAAQGHRYGQYSLGVMYAEGRGVGRDDAQAVKWFKLAVEQGCVLAAQAKLAMMTEQGRGIVRNPSEAAKLYHEAAKYGNDEALAWYRKDAEQGKKEATSVYLIAAMTSKNPKAIEFLRARAEKEDGDAQSILGLMYYNDCLSTKSGKAAFDESEDHRVEAGKWLKKGAEKGGDIAQATIAWMYEHGANGLPKDAGQAAKWYEKAAQQGHAWAQLNIARMYAGGLGVKRDEKEARKWLEKAAQQKEGREKEIAKGLLKRMENDKKYDNLAIDLKSQTSCGSVCCAAKLECGRSQFCADSPDIASYLRHLRLLDLYRY